MSETAVFQKPVLSSNYRELDKKLSFCYSRAGARSVNSRGVYLAVGALRDQVDQARRNPDASKNNLKKLIDGGEFPAYSGTRC